MTARAAPRAVVRRPQPLRDIFRRRLGRVLRAPFPDCGGNSVEPLAHGAHFYDVMIGAIDDAQSAVDVEMYLWHDDEVGAFFVDALARAARRGVRVRVLADAQGAREAIELLDLVTRAGGDVRVFNPFRIRWWRRYFTRTHKKLLLLDGARAFSGGAGFSLHFSGTKADERPWFDRMYEIRGPVVTQLEVVFEADFQRWCPAGEPREAPDVTVPVLAPPRAAGGAAVRVLRGWPDARDFPPLFLRAIREAKERVWIGTPYFLPPRSVRRALYDAAERGCDVRVIVPSLPHANAVLYHAVRARYGRYLHRGVRLHEFRSAFYHAKTFVADRSLALIGSSNLDSWSWRRNAEIDLAVTDAETVGRIASLLAADRESSHEIAPDEARIRDFLASAKASLASAIEDWL